ncbi:flagellin [Polycladidibacter stylochi]|uniref:flagellin N-terminal helical domain-containing protein n=1 Tax=Polycladidibacter stylochi TaxID=1807766 RepID=UPI00083448DB|nr:flagellin [Pseudovibrio stylochi]
MSSLLTNTSAMVALQTLQGINDQMATTQNRISTGLRVADASDNAAYWSIATTMKSDNGALSAVKDALGLGAATVDVAFTAMDQAVKTVDEIKQKLVAAREPGVDRAKIQEDVAALQEQLQTIASSANFNGENWLEQAIGTANTNKEVVGSFSRSGTAVSIETITVDTSGVVLVDSAGGNAGLLDTVLTDGASTMLTIDISALTDSAADLAKLDTLVSDVDGQLSKMTDAATTLGSAKKRIDMQQDFVGALSDAISRGVGQLVDADMNAESTRLKALQTQQQLGIQALSIANSGSQNILSLFR